MFTCLLHLVHSWIFYHFRWIYSKNLFPKLFNAGKRLFQIVRCSCTITKLINHCHLGLQEFIRYFHISLCQLLFKYYYNFCFYRKVNSKTPILACTFLTACTIMVYHYQTGTELYYVFVLVDTICIHFRELDR